jgi:hypothetical protein
MGSGVAGVACGEKERCVGGRTGRQERGGAGTVGTRDTSLPDCWQLPAENNIPYTKTVGGRPASILSDHNPRHKAISTL